TVDLTHPHSFPTRRSSDLWSAALDFDSPSAAATSRTYCSRRPSSISATRYRIWPRLYAVAPDQPPNALRAADTASRASLREDWRSEEHTSELQSRENLVCR